VLGVHVLLVVDVAGETGEIGIAGGVRVTDRATGPGVFVSPRVDSEIEPVVVDIGRPPCRRRVTGNAGRRISRRNVARIERSLVVGPVTRVAILRRPRELAAGVALLAGRRPVRARKGEPGEGVIESRPTPPGLARVVTSFAASRESTGHVVRVLRGDIRLHVARVAGSRDRSPGLLAEVDMTAGTLHEAVHTSEREPGARVVGDRLRAARPALRGVAILAAGATTPFVHVPVAVGARRRHT